MTPHESRIKQIENAFSVIVNALAEMDRASLNAYASATAATSAAGEARLVALNARDTVCKVERVQLNYQSDMNHIIERVKNLEQNMPTCRTLQEEHDKLRASIIDCQNKTYDLVSTVKKLEEISKSGQQWAHGIDERVTELTARLDRAVARLNANESQPLPTTRHGVPVDRVAVLRCIAGLWERLATTIERGTEHGSNVSNSVRVAMARELLDLMKFHIGEHLINVQSALSPQDEGQTRKETNE